MIRLGLFLYDHLGRARLALSGRGSSLPKSRAVSLEGDLGAALKPEFRRGFTYFDAWVDDARLVVLNARSAAAKGAVILSRTRCIGGARVGGVWRLELRDTRTGVVYPVEARAVGFVCAATRTAAWPGPSARRRWRSCRCRPPAAAAPRRRRASERPGRDRFRTLPAGAR